jgi:hypothetical protein
MGKFKFFNYSTSNNCQAFIQGLLVGNNIQNNDILSFVKQNTDSVFKSHPNLRKFSNSLTGLAGKVIDPIMQGGKLKTNRSPWIEYVKEFHSSHPEHSYKECLQLCAKTYKK